MNYQKFLENKITISTMTGFVPDTKTEHLKPHQVDIVSWAIMRGKGLIAASFGLGKTRIEIEILRQIHERTKKKVLVVCPLGVKHQFSDEDGPVMGIRFQYVRTDQEAMESDTPYLITNYERVREADISREFLEREVGGCSLDEGSVLRSLGSDTQLTFTEVMQDIPFRYVATATPSPNDYKELIYYAQYLGVMDAGQALTRWFKRDPQHAGHLTLHPHLEREFWLWVASWALFIGKPSDLGHSDEGYSLPPMKVIWHKVATDHKAAWNREDSWGQHKMFSDSAASIGDAVKEKRNSLDRRIYKAAEIVSDADPADHWLIWHHLEDERRAICKAIPETVEVYGSQSIEEREKRILDFVHGKSRIFASKPELNGQGCNFQRYCHKAIFVGVRYQFEEFIQAVHRIFRFLQDKEVEIHIIHTEAENQVVNVLKKKWVQHNKLVEKMSAIVKEYGMLNEALKSDLQRSIGSSREEESGEMFRAIKHDSVLEMANFKDNSIDLIHTSIPFGNHYEYSASYNDFGHNEDDKSFWDQMDFLVPELYRALKPGRIAAIHAKDRLLYGHQNGLGVMSISPFSDDCIRSFVKHGFIFFGRITIVTDVVRENSSTYRLGWTENSKDSTKMGVGMPEYLLLFRKRQTDISKAYADEPVTKDKAEYMRSQWQIDAHSFWRSSGDRQLKPEEVEELPPDVLKNLETGQIYRWYLKYSKNTVYDYHKHVNFAKPLEKEGRLPASFMTLPPQGPECSGHGRNGSAVWTDITFMQTLNANQVRRRCESHVCPLPFDIVERVINRYSNKGEVVLDPFAGLFTVPLIALRMGRTGIGIELSRDYWEFGYSYLRDEEKRMKVPTLFDISMGEMS
jgi:DNA modification methylase